MTPPNDPSIVVTDGGSPEVVVQPVERPSLSIVIVTYGTGPVVIETIRSVVANTERSTPFEVIVVDNACSDGATAELLMTRSRGVRLVRLPTNVGFGPANDVGVSIARADHVCLCNPDVVVPAGWLPPLLAGLDDPVVGVAAPVLLNPDGSLQEAGQVLFDDGCTAAIGGPELATGDVEHVFSRDVDYASAALWVLRRSEYLGFNPRLVPAYFEDVDYALRLEARGQVTRLIADRPVVHLHGASVPGDVAPIAIESRRVFREEWEHRIGQQLARPASAGDVVALRDRTCTARVAVIPARPTDNVTAERLAMEIAQQAPRERCTLMTAHPLAAGEHRLRSAGVEVAARAPADTLASRPNWATRVIVVGRRAPRGAVRAVRRSQPRVLEIEKLLQ